MRLAGKKALISGAARGIGYAFAKSFIAEGATVALADIDSGRLNQATNELGKAAVAIEMDVSRQASIDNGVAAAIKKLGQIDILINNAAVFTAAPISEITRADFDRIFAINVAGVLFTLQAVARHMIARGAGGKVINMASQAGRRGEPLVALYCASKAAVISITQSAALNLIKHRINVNAIAPGVVAGEHWQQVDAFFAKYENKPLGQKQREVSKQVPYGRMGQPGDLTGMAVFLASEAAEFIVGQCYNVDGGNWLS